MEKHGLQPGDLGRPVQPNLAVTNKFDDPRTRLLEVYEGLGHEGIDWAGSPIDIYAMAPGRVVQVVRDPKQGKAYGVFVHLCTETHDPSVAYSGFDHIYAHMKEGSVRVQEGQAVDKGQELGQIGNTGTVNDHLHVTLRPHLPAIGASRRKTDHSGRNVNPGAVFIRGGIDFSPYLEGETWSGKFLVDTAGNNKGSYTLSASGSRVTLKVTGNDVAVNDNVLFVVQEGFRPTDDPQEITLKSPGTDTVLSGLTLLVKPTGEVIHKYATRPTSNVNYVGELSWSVASYKAPSVPEEVPLQDSHLRVTNRDGLNFRDGPSQSNNSLYLIQPNCTYYPILAQKKGVKYQWWQVRLLDGSTGWMASRALTSGATPLAAVYPAAPTDLKPTVTGSDVTLTWKAPQVPDETGDDQDMAGITYRVLRGSLKWYLVTLKKDTESSVPSWTDHDPRPGDNYYAVAALAGDVAGPRSDVGHVFVRQGAQAAVDRLVAGQAVSVRQHLFDKNPSSTTVRDNTTYAIDGKVRNQWLLLGAAVPASATQRAGTAGAADSAPASGTTGWVPRDSMRVIGDLATVPSPPYLRLSSWVTLGSNVRAGPGKAYDRRTTLTDHSLWYRVVGKDAATAAWWRIEYAAGTYGWIYAELVDTTGDLSDVPVQSADSPAPVEPAPTGAAATGTATAAASASGDFLNLATSWAGFWKVTKNGRQVTARFSSSRSPVQWYARQNPDKLFVLPEGFRPTSTVRHTATGTHVHEDGTFYAGSPRASFGLTIGTNGEMRYVDDSRVDHVGFLNYSVTGLQWTTAEALVTPTDPAQPGDISDSGTYHNQQVNWGSSWSLTRRGNTVTGSFTTTRSPAEYFANQNREAVVWLPGDYWPAADARFQVRGSRRVEEDGTDSADSRLVDFWVTVQSRDGRLYYDRDASLATQGVGYVRYTLNVSWTAAPRATVPGAPGNLHTDGVDADEVELDWEAPTTNGGAAITEYRVEVYRNGAWETEEDDISRTGYDVEDLAPYTTYSFRVRARNSVDWSDPSTALTVTTERARPGRPSSLTASATHNAVTLRWGSAAGTVTGYRIERQAAGRDWETVVHDTRVTTRSWVDRGVSPATTYYYRVAASNHGVLGSSSSVRSIRTSAAPTVPGQVTGLGVAPGSDSRLQLTWTAPTNTGGGIAGYRVERSPDETPRAWAILQADTGSSAVTWGDDGVAPDTVYHYRVSAQNSAGVGTPSDEAEGTSRPQLPLAADAQYPLEARSEPRSSAGVTATFAAYLPGRSYDLVARVPGAEGWWEVLLFGQGARGPFWLPSAAGTPVGDTSALPQPPAVPGSLTATLAAGAVTLTWSVPAAGGTVTGYRLWRQEDGGAFALQGNDLGATALTTTDDTVANGHVYRYWVQALSDVGPGLPSAVAAVAVMATPAAPDAVRNLLVAATGYTLRLAWQKAATGGLPTGYRVQWRVAGSTDDFVGVEVPGTSHEVTDLAPATSYELRVLAFNQVGTAAAASRTGTTLQVAPGAPAGLAVAVRAQTAAVSWEAPATGGVPDHYHLQYKLQSAAAWPDTYTTVAGTGHSLSGLEADAAYDVQVRAGNTAGQSAWVGAQFTAGPEVPGVPARVRVAVRAQTAAVSWDAPATGGAPDAYHLQHKLQSETAWPDAYTTVAGTGHDLSGLEANAAYDVQVRAHNASGSSAWVAATFTAGPEVPGTVGNLTAAATGSSLRLTWDAPAAGGTPAGYRVEWRAAADTEATFTAATATGPAHTVTGLEPLTAYDLRVTAFNASGDGPAVAHGATTLQVAPGVPASLTAAARDATTALVSWDAPATGGAPDAYHLQSKTRAAPWPADTVYTTVSGLSHTLGSLIAGTTYDVRVRAGNTAGQSAWEVTEFIAGLPRPAAPTAPTTAYDSANTLAVGWTAAAGSPAPTHYEVQWQATENLPAGSLLWPAVWQATVVAAPGTSATLAVLDGQAFAVRVRSSVGDPASANPLRVSDWVDAPAVAARATTARPPSPGHLRAELVPGTTDRYRLAWDLVGLAGQVPDHFYLTYGVGGGPTVEVARVTTPHWEPAEGLGPGTTWWMVVNCIVGTASHFYPYHSGTTPAA